MKDSIPGIRFELQVFTSSVLQAPQWLQEVGHRVSVSMAHQPVTRFTFAGTRDNYGHAPARLNDFFDLLTTGGTPSELVFLCERFSMGSLFPELLENGFDARNP